MAPAREEKDAPDTLDHLQDSLEPAFPSAHVAPRRAHAEARRAVLLGLSCLAVESGRHTGARINVGITDRNEKSVEIDQDHFGET